MTRGLIPSEVRHLIIDPVLDCFDLYSDGAAELVLYTGVVESELRHLKQIEGPALGLWQMEPRTHDDIWQNYVSFRPDLAQKLIEFGHLAQHLVYRLDYAAIMCRLHYRRDSDPLPEAGDIEGMARYWKRVYNTGAGKGTESQFIFKASLARKGEINVHEI